MEANYTRMTRARAGLPACERACVRACVHVCVRTCVLCTRASEFDGQEEMDKQGEIIAAQL